MKMDDQTGYYVRDLWLWVSLTFEGEKNKQHVENPNLYCSIRLQVLEAVRRNNSQLPENKA